MERNTKPKNVIKAEKQVYYTQRNENIDRSYNNSSEENDSLNNKRIHDRENIYDIQNITASEKNSPPLPVYN